MIQEAIQKGFKNIISIAGDGTLHHVVKGIIAQRYVKSSNITIAVLPLGTGNDWVKTSNITNKIKKLMEYICQK